MSIIGIVCEYNPFHLGHLHQIKESKRLLGEDSVIICTMSGDFVQRGEPAAFNKFARAEAACRCGADIVIELPLPWSLSSAERFASGSVDILAAAGCTHISFGSESGDIDKLTSLARYAASDSIRQNVKTLYKCSAALPYAKVRQLAIEREVGEDADLLSKPNNILAVEYIKAIINKELDITPCTIKRIGNAHDKKGAEGPRSASELREMLFSGEVINDFIPAEAMEVYRAEMEQGRMLNKDVMEVALVSRLRMFDETYFDNLPDSGEGAGRRLFKSVREHTNTHDMAYYAATRPYPFARMRRMLMCAALGISADSTKGPPPYMRILALNEKGRAYLRKLENSAIPVLTKPSEVKNMSTEAKRVFAAGAYAHDLYRLQFVTNNDKKPGCDWRKGPVIV